jgi:hypothetical protein
LNIAKDLTIRGPGVDILSISGGQIHMIFGTTVTISGLAFKGGISPNVFIINEGTLTLSTSTISGNTATGYSNGGGIYNSGTLTLSTSTISGNTASNTIGSGSAGGIYNSGTLTLSTSTISGNTATDGGGGILIQGYLNGDGNSGAYADLKNCTMYGNTAHGGGDITIEDVFTDSVGNTKPTNQRTQVAISNSIVAGDPAHPGPDIVGMLTSSGYNLFQDNSGATFDPATSTLHSFDKLLSVNDLTRLFASPVELRDNGGPTRTYALAPDGPAIDAVPLDSCYISGSDQRGVKRPDGNESACDIGAYEYVDSPT